MPEGRQGPVDAVQVSGEVPSHRGIGAQPGQRLGACQADRACRPALMTTLPQHASHSGVDVMIKQEAH